MCKVVVLVIKRKTYCFCDVLVTVAVVGSVPTTVLEPGTG